MVFEIQYPLFGQYPFSKKGVIFEKGGGDLNSGQDFFNDPGKVPLFLLGESCNDFLGHLDVEIMMFFKHITTTGGQFYERPL